MINCRFYKTVYNIDKSITCNRLCSGCYVITKYKELLYNGKIDIIDDISKFREQKHPNKKKRRV